MIAIAVVIGGAVSCKMFGGGGNGNTNAANTSNGATLANANKVRKMPVPADECTKMTLEVYMVDDSDKKEEYLGCTISVKGKLWKVDPDAVELIDNAQRTDSKGGVFCSGNFAGETYAKVGQKLTQLRINSDLDNLPRATLTCTVKENDGYEGLGLKDCLMTDFTK